MPGRPAPWRWKRRNGSTEADQPLNEAGRRGKRLVEPGLCLVAIDIGLDARHRGFGFCIGRAGWVIGRDWLHDGRRLFTPRRLALHGRRHAGLDRRRAVQQPGIPRIVGGNERDILLLELGLEVAARIGGNLGEIVAWSCAEAEAVERDKRRIGRRCI